MDKVLAKIIDKICFIVGFILCILGMYFFLSALLCGIQTLTGIQIFIESSLFCESFCPTTMTFCIFIGIVIFIIGIVLILIGSYIVK